MEKLRAEFYAWLAHARVLWRGVSPRRQGAVLFAAGAILLGLVLSLAKHPAAPDDGFFAIRRYEDLNERSKEYVKANYKDLLVAHEVKDFSRMALDADKILQLVDEYNDTLSYRTIAARGMRQVEEERVRRSVDDRKLLEQSEAAEMVRALEERLPQALENAAERPPFLAKVAEVLLKDPNNAAALGMRRELAEHDAGEKRKKNVREIASLEIKGQGLLRSSVSNADSRAQLYEIMDRLKALDPANTYPGDWNQSLHRGAR